MATSTIVPGRRDGRPIILTVVAGVCALPLMLHGLIVTVYSLTESPPEPTLAAVFSGLLLLPVVGAALGAAVGLVRRRARVRVWHHAVLSALVVSAPADVLLLGMYVLLVVGLAG